MSIPVTDIWTPVSYEKSRARRSTTTTVATVSIHSTTKKPNGEPRFNQLVISADLVDEACWSAGDRVTLFKAGADLFMLKPQIAGLETLRKQSSRSKGLRITSVNMVGSFFKYIHKGVTQFDAWVDDDAIIFKPRYNKEEEK